MPTDHCMATWPTKFIYSDVSYSGEGRLASLLSSYEITACSDINNVHIC